MNKKKEIACVIIATKLSNSWLGGTFIKAWSNFIQRQSKNLPCDIFVMLAHFDKADESYYAPGCNVIYAPTSWDQGLGLHIPSILALSDYKYIVRIDHDAFITHQSLENICEFLLTQKEIDYASPSNCPRGAWFHSKEASDIFHAKTNTNSRWPSLLPWGTPLNNGDLWIVRSKFMLESIKDVSNNFSDFTFKKMTYGQTCDYLKFKRPILSTPHVRDSIFGLDGAFPNDLWTAMIGRKMRAVGVVNTDGKSFCHKNTLRNFWTISGQPGGYSSVTDPVDLSWPYEKAIRIDGLLHTENGYVASVFEKPILEDGTFNPFVGAVESFVNSPTGYWGLLFSFLYILIENVFLDRLKEINGTLQLLEDRGLDINVVKETTNKMRSFYEPILKEYI